MTKQELLTRLTTEGTLSAIAFIPVSEVIKLVNELEETEATITNEMIDDIVDEIISEDLDLISDYDLSMSYREVELDSIRIDDDVVRRAIRRALEVE